LKCQSRFVEDDNLKYEVVRDEHCRF